MFITGVMTQAMLWSWVYLPRQTIKAKVYPFGGIGDKFFFAAAA